MVDSNILQSKVACYYLLVLSRGWCITCVEWYYRLWIYHRYIWHNSEDTTTINMIKLRSDLHSWWTPHPHPYGWALGCPSWVIWWKMTVIYQGRTVSCHCEHRVCTVMKMSILHDIVCSTAVAEAECQSKFNSSPPIYASVNWISIGSDNGLSPIRRQTII